MSTRRSHVNLAIIATHPIQYQAPWFRELSQTDGIQTKVYYLFVPDRQQQGIGFNHDFQWDISLLDGYDWKTLRSRIRHDSDAFFANRSYDFSAQLCKDKIDVCLITGWQSFGLLQAVVACRKLGIKTLIRGDSNSIGARPGWKKLLHRILFSQYDAFLAVGKENKRFYMENGVDPARIFWCPHFIDNDRFFIQAQEAKNRRQSMRQNWGVLERKICFIFCGKFATKKRLPDLVHALEIASRQNEMLHLLVVGSGEQDAQVRQMTIRISSSVTFLGFLNQTEISDAYVAADCLILPSDHNETWGLVVNEAMACGIPALVSDQVGCGRDLIICGETGSIFRCGDIEDLSQKMSWAAAQRDILQCMGNNAREHIKQYSIENATKGLLEAVKAVVV